MTDIETEKDYLSYSNSDNSSIDNNSDNNNRNNVSGKEIMKIPETTAITTEVSELTTRSSAVSSSRRIGKGSSDKTRKSSLFLDSSKDVEIIELKLENVTYEPVTSTATSSSPSSSAAAAAVKAICFCRNDKKKATKLNTTTIATSNSNRTTVLSNITTTISPFKLTAWMGPSGSGKTSLTSVVAGLINDAETSIRGTIKVNGDEGRIPKQYVGVVWQDDLLLSNLTVEETIYFAARLKTPKDKPDCEVTKLVEETMEELGLIHIRNNLIGSPIANRPGISGGERKRTSVAAELVVKPSVLLLDEPTSGLDATTASSLMSTLKQLAKNGHSIATVIHQPRTDIYKMLDHLLLLSKGHVLYDGPADMARTYLESCPSVDQLPPETGIADWIMDTIIFDEATAKSCKTDNCADNTNGSTTASALANNWKSYCTEKGKPLLSEEISEEQQQQQQLLNRRFSSLLELEENPMKFEASFTKQLSLLLSRTLKQRRGEKFTSVSILLTLCYILFTSLFWWRLPDTTAYVFPRNSIIFFFLIAQGNSIVVSSMTVFQQERALLSRERAKKMYGVLPYFVSKTISDMTNNILLPLCYGIICYYTVGLRPDIVSFLKFVLGYYLTLSCAQSMGFFLSSLIPNLQMGLILAPPLTLFFFILGGFYIPLADMHVGIKWATYISFARYGYSALLVNEYSGREIPCSDDDVSISVGDSSSCPMQGDSVYESVGIDGVFASFWFNILMVALLDIFFRTGAYGLLRRSK